MNPKQQSKQDLERHKATFIGKHSGKKFLVSGH